MHGPAVAALAVAAVAAACGERAAAPPAPRPGPDGLRAFLAAARRDPAAAAAAWAVPEASWPALVTEAYRGHRDAYLARLAARADALRAALAAWDDGAIYPQYVDDPRLTPAQVRGRWMLGRTGTVAAGIPAVFVFEAGSWRAVVDLDPVVLAGLDTEPGCAAAYLAMEPKPCREWAWVIAEGVLRGDATRRARACAQARAIGCGR